MLTFALICTLKNIFPYLYFWLSTTGSIVCAYMCVCKCSGPRSVFELLDSKDRERLSEIRKAAEEKRAGCLQDRFQYSTSTVQSAARTQPQVSKAKTDLQLQPRASDTTQQALNIWSSPTAQTGQTFKPFEKNPSKQARYDRYISHLKQGNKGEKPSVPEFLNTNHHSFCFWSFNKSFSYSLDEEVNKTKY